MVDPAYQGQGIGRLLVRWGLAHADSLGVEASVVVRCGAISELTQLGFGGKLRTRSKAVSIRRV